MLFGEVIDADERAGKRGVLWQRGYYEHVIRNEKGLDRIPAYVRRCWANSSRQILSWGRVGKSPRALPAPLHTMVGVESLGRKTRKMRAGAPNICEKCAHGARAKLRVMIQEFDELRRREQGRKKIPP
jgi:hypothetical protein